MSNSQANYYEILGISPDAGFDEIRAVYRRLAFLYHPDRNSDPLAQEQFQRVIEAFSVLSDPEKRRDYDAVLLPTSLVIRSDLAQSAIDLYEEVAGATPHANSFSAREEYLRHLRIGRRKRALVQTVIAIIVILLLILYGFKPLEATSSAVSATTSSSGSSQSSSSAGKPGSSLNQRLIVVEGEAGPQGLPGPAGRDGRIGVDGIPGPAGAAGADGAAGPPGADGKDGAVGSPGLPGAPGAPGAQGAPGAAGTAGPAGPAGRDGRDGQDATVYTVKPNIGAVAGFIGPCNQNLSDTSTAPGLNVTISTLFDANSSDYKLKSFNFKGFTPPCRGAQLGINITLASNASSNPNATFQCVKLIPNNVIESDTVKFESGSSGECTKYSGWGGANGSALDLGIIVASDLARINLIVTG